MLWVTNGLLAFLVLKLVQGATFPKYVVFGLYLTYVLVTRLVESFIYSFRPSSYFVTYWSLHFFTVIAGYCLMWEIYGHVFASYQGIGKVARRAVSLFFVIFLAISLFTAFSGGGTALTRSVVQLERNFRAVQGMLLAVLVACVWYYRIPLGRNMRGLILGYGVYISVGVVTLTLRSYVGPNFQLWWQGLQQTSYLMVLGIWLYAFWKYFPSPAADHEIGLEQDYALLADRTRSAITRAKAQIARAFVS